MIRHGLLNIHPAKAAWQETRAHALDGSHSAAANQKGGNIQKLRCGLRTECPPFGRCGSHNIDGRAIQRNGTNPKFP